jgi:hypothetical protein
MTMITTRIFTMLMIFCSCADLATTPESDGGSIADANPDASPSNDESPCDIVETLSYYGAEGIVTRITKSFRAPLSGAWHSIWLCRDEPSIGSGINVCEDGEVINCHQPSNEYYVPECTMALPHRKIDGSLFVLCGVQIEQDTNGDGVFDSIVGTVADRVEIWR